MFISGKPFLCLVLLQLLQSLVSGQYVCPCATMGHRQLYYCDATYVLKVKIIERKSGQTALGEAMFSASIKRWFKPAWWRGEVTGTLTLIEELDCGILLQKDKAYIVFGNEIQNNTVFFIRKCTSVIWLDSAATRRNANNNYYARGCHCWNSTTAPAGSESHCRRKHAYLQSNCTWFEGNSYRVCREEGFS